MKRIVFLFFVMLSGLTYAQNGMVFSKLIGTDSVGKGIIYDNVKEWYVGFFNSEKDVIKTDKKEAGTIVGNASIKYSYGTTALVNLDGTIDFLIRIVMQDNQAKIILSNFTHKKSNLKAAAYNEFGLITYDIECPVATGLNKAWQNKAWDDMKKKITAYSNTVFSSLEAKLNNIKKSKGNK